MHYMEVCEWGAIHGQCRCPGPNKSVKRVVCNNPDHMDKGLHQISPMSWHDKPLMERPALPTLRDRFKHAFTEGGLDLLADQESIVLDLLEEEVKLWLIYQAKTIGASRGRGTNV